VDSVGLADQVSLFLQSHQQAFEVQECDARGREILLEYMAQSLL
jgi:hypothetical protein